MNWRGWDNLRQFLIRTPFGRPVIKLYRFAKTGKVESPEERFRRFSLQNNWGSEESVSGPGSTLEYTQNIRAEIPQILDRFGITSILDAPCGDYNWFRLIPRHKNVRYVGADIVPELVKANNRQYHDDSTSFIELNIIKQRPPSADLWICRDALFHFSQKDIGLTVDQFLDSNIKYILTTSHTECPKNEDTITGEFRLLNLQLSPYNFPEPILWIDDWIEGHPVRKLGLWEREALAAAIAQAGSRS